MGVNFPSSPSAGQAFVSGNTLYTFTNGVWRASQLGTALPFNHIVNGDMRISQQNGDAGLTASTAYCADQWWCQFAGVIVPAFYRADSGGTPNGSAKALVMQVPAKPTLAAGDYCFFSQRLEGTRVADFQWGTASAKQVVLVVHAKIATQGTYAVSIRNSVPDRSWLGSYTIGAADSNKWVRRVLVVPGDTTGTWPSDTAFSMQVDFSFAVGSTFVAPAAGWNAGNLLAPPGTTNIAASATSLMIGDIGLYLDPYKTGRAPVFEGVPDRACLYECLRYFHKHQHMNGVAVSNTTTPQRIGMINQAPMRIAPSATIVGTLSSTDAAVQTNISAISTSYYNQWIDEANFTSAAAQTLGRGVVQNAVVNTNHVAVSARM